MNKAQLIEQVSERLETSRKEAADAVEAVFESISEAVAEGERVAISGFGIFEQAFRNARTGRNPRTGETVKIAAITLPKFRPGQEFKTLVAGAKKAAKKAPAKTAAAKKTAAKKAAPVPAAAKKAVAPAKAAASASSATSSPPTTTRPASCRSSSSTASTAAIPTA